MVRPAERRMQLGRVLRGDAPGRARTGVDEPPRAAAEAGRSRLDRGPEHGQGCFDRRDGRRMPLQHAGERVGGRPGVGVGVAGDAGLGIQAAEPPTTGAAKASGSAWPA